MTVTATGELLEFLHLTSMRVNKDTTLGSTLDHTHKLSVTIKNNKPKLLELILLLKNESELTHGKFEIQHFHFEAR